jgi:small-conductance mechanosensitive channel
MFEQILTLLNPYLNAVLIGFVGFAAAFIVGQLLGRALKKPLGDSWGPFVGNLAGLGIAIYTIKLILDSAGAAGVVVVLATALTGAFAIGSERLAADIVSGMGLFFNKPYKDGDMINVSGQTGKVQRIDLTTTTLTNVSGDKIIIRNSDISESTIINYSALAGHLIQVRVMINANENLEKAIALIAEAVKDFSPKSENPDFKTTIVADDVNSGFIVIFIRTYVEERLDYAPLRSEILRAAVKTLQDHNFKLLP